MTHATEARDTAAPAHRTKILDLSLSQLIGSSLAAATAAALGSRLGVMGTIAGAAVISVVSAVAAAVYTTSLRRTRSGVATAALAVTRGRPVPPGVARHGRRAVVGATAVFAIAAAGVTVFELGAGTSLDGGGRTTFTRLAPTAAKVGPGPRTSLQPGEARPQRSAEDGAAEPATSPEEPDAPAEPDETAPPEQPPVEEPAPTDQPEPTDEPQPQPEPDTAP